MVPSTKCVLIFFPAEVTDLPLPEERIIRTIGIRQIDSRIRIGSSQIHAADLFAPVYSFCAVVSRPGRPIFACFCAFALLCEWLREFEFFVYGGETTRKHRAALAALVAPFRSSVGSRARAVIGKAGYIKRYL